MEALLARFDTAPPKMREASYVHGLNQVHQSDSTFSDYLKKENQNVEKFQTTDGSPAVSKEKADGDLHTRDVQNVEQSQNAEQSQNTERTEAQGLDAKNEVQKNAVAPNTLSPQNEKNEVNVADELFQDIDEAENVEVAQQEHSKDVLQDEVQETVFFEQDGANTDKKNAYVIARLLEGTDNKAKIEKPAKNSSIRNDEQDVSLANTIFASESVHKPLSSEVTAIKTDEFFETEKVSSLAQKTEYVFNDISAIVVEDYRTQSIGEKQKIKGFGADTSRSSVTMDMPLITNQVGDTLVNKATGTELLGAQQSLKFTSMLSEQIQQQATELVKAGTLVLQDGNKGTINLILHPEHLGNVKISLKVSENVLSGKIMVASEEAYNAFKANIAALKTAFNDQGFDTTNLDLSMSNSSNFAQGGQRESGKGTLFSNQRQQFVSVPESFAERMEEQAFIKDSYVNLMA